MLEVLITIVVVSIGLLGLAGLQFAGLRAVNGAQEHTLAVLLMQDIEERIHSNSGTDYGGVNLNGNSAVSAVSCDSGNPCDSMTMFTYDQDQWTQMIAKPLLPNLAINIAHSVTASNDYYTATVTWGHSDNPQTLTAKFAP
jgi:type IV pilus assembly protein PilV